MDLWDAAGKEGNEGEERIGLNRGIFFIRWGDKVVIFCIIQPDFLRA